MTDLIEAFATEIKGVIGEDILPEKGGEGYLSGERTVVLGVLSKAKSQKAALSRLEAVCAMNVTVKTPPYFAGFEKEMYLYKCTIEIGGEL